MRLRHLWALTLALLGLSKFQLSTSQTIQMTKKYSFNNQSDLISASNQENNDFIPLTSLRLRQPQTNSQKLIREIDLRARTSKSSGPRDFESTSLAGNKVMTPSSSPFFNLLNKANNGHPLTTANSNEKSSNNEKHLADFGKLMESENRAINYNKQHEEMSKRQMLNQPRLASGSELDAPLIFATGNQLQVDSPMNRQEHSISDQASNLSGQDQLENSFYLNSLGSQQLFAGPHDDGNNNEVVMGIPSNQFQLPPGAPFTGALNQDISTAQNYYSPNHHHPASPLNSDKQAFIMPTTDEGFHVNNAPGHLMRQAGTKADRKTKTNSIQAKETLSNAQLVSLIDELKEFNRKQANKVAKSILPSSQTPSGSSNHAKLGKSPEHDRLFTKLVESLNRSKPSSGSEDETGQSATKSADDDQDSDDDSQKDDDQRGDDELTGADLAKFAKFLLARDNANAKLLSGVKRDSSDDTDEDEDIKDTLIDWGKKKSKAESRQDPTISSKNGKQTEIDSQIDRFIDNLSDRSKKSSRSPKVKQSEYENYIRKLLEATRNQNDRARKRRDQYSHTTIRPIDLLGNDKLNESSLNGVKPSNLIKVSTKIELSDEKKGENAISTQLRNMTDPVEADRRSDFDSDDALNNSSESEVKFGESKLKYPKNERNKDRLSLKQSLYKARGDKIKMRPRTSAPVDTLVRKALDNELDRISEQNPEAKLSLIANGKLKQNHYDDNDYSVALVDDEARSAEKDSISGRVDPEKGLIELQGKSGDLKEDYPISDKVADKLNKLSHNLDRYFNDGFLHEAEKKFPKPTEKDKRQGAESKQRPQLTSVHDRKNDDSASKGKQLSNMQGMTGKDSDFDVDVGIDGKRDRPDPDEDDSSIDREDPSNKSNPALKRTGKKSRKRQVARREDRRKRRNSRTNKLGDNNLGHSVNESGNSRKNSLSIMSGETDKKISKADPVDMEDIETPIGPDENDISEFGSTTGSKGSRESQTKLAKKSSDKFYQEPD